MSPWQPIETAPRYRGPILLCVPTLWRKWQPTIAAQGRRLGDFWVIFNADEAVQRVEPIGWMSLPEAPPLAPHPVPPARMRWPFDRQL